MPVVDDLYFVMFGVVGEDEWRWAGPFDNTAAAYQTVNVILSSNVNLSVAVRSFDNIENLLENHRDLVEDDYADLLEYLVETYTVVDDDDEFDDEEDDESSDDDLGGF